MPPYFTGDNLFEASLSGSLLNPLTVISFSDEPVGLDVNPVNRHLFISDDTGQKRVYELDPGPDGQYNTADDSVTSFSTSAFGSNDPEGVAFDPTGLGTLFIADGINREVYRVTPGANGLFDGVDDQVTHFDTLSLGWDDPEGIAFNPVSGTLYAVGKPASTLFELTTGGSLVRTIDISVANARKPAGLALGPSSVNPGEMSIYIAARGVDNNSDPNENDGKVYEIALGISVSTPTDTPTVTPTPTATDTPIPPTQYTLTVNTVGSGSVALNPPGGVYNAGTQVTLPATPAAGWSFSGWSGDLTGSTNPATLTMNANKSVTATFTQTPGGEVRHEETRTGI